MPMTRRLLALVLFALVLLSGVAPHRCGATPNAAQAAVEEAAAMPCHDTAAAQSGPSHPRSPAAPEGKGCCGGAAGSTCPHACQVLAVVAPAPAPVAVASAVPLVEIPSGRLVVPPLAPPDHVPLA
jgi:hypothetical protein